MLGLLVGVLALTGVGAEFSLIYEWPSVNLGGFELAPDFPGAGSSRSTALLYTSYSFGDFGVDNVGVIRDFPGKVARNQSAEPERLTTGSVWPRTSDFLASTDIVGVRDAIVVCRGFLLPFKNPGGVDLYVVNSQTGAIQQRVPVARDEAAFFYTRMVLVDLNGDGRKDILTARAESAFPPIPGAPSRGEILWFEQPPQPLTQPWPQHSLAAGVDVAGVNFRIADLDGDGLFEIVAAGYFELKLVIYYCELGSWARCDGTTTRSRVVEDAIDRVFDLHVVDINNDGRLDIFATNNRGDGQGAAYAYELPDDFRTGPFVRHTLLSGLSVPIPLPGLGTPGSLEVWRPRRRANLKPLLFVCGDDNGELYQLTPSTENPRDWSYVVRVIVKAYGVLNWIRFEDVDGDGERELLVALYGERKGQVYRWRDSLALEA